MENAETFIAMIDQNVIDSIDEVNLRFEYKLHCNREQTVLLAFCEHFKKNGTSDMFSSFACSYYQMYMGITKFISKYKYF